MNSLPEYQGVEQKLEAAPMREDEFMRSPSVVRACLMAGAAMFMFAPSFALAQTPPSRADLEARVKALEEALAGVRAELESSRARDAATDDKLIRVERQVAQAPAPAAPAPAADGFKVGDTTIKFGGFVKAEALVSDFADGAPPSAGAPAAALGREFYLPSQIPVGAPASSQDWVTDLHAKQTRLSMTATTPIGDQKVTTYVEGDFQTSPGTQGSERTTNGYNLALRRAYFQSGDWLFGQDWSTFMNTGALPETPDFIGPTEGTVFVRQVQARYTAKLSDTVNLQFALESPETASVTPGSATLNENDDDVLPDLVGRVNFKNDLGEFTVAGLVRQLRIASGSLDEDATGWGLNVSGKVKVGESDDIRFSLTGGEGIGRYVGLNFAPDASDTATGFEAIGVLAGFVAYKHAWDKEWRSTVTYSFQNVDNETGLVAATSSDSAWSAAANLFYTPVKGVDLGVEVRRAERELFNGQDGALNRLHFVAKRSF
jgi:hypothetical protein